MKYKQCISNLFKIRTSILIIVGLLLSNSIFAQQIRGWKVPFDGSASEPVIVDGTLYIGSFDGAVYAFDARTGEQKWRFQTGEGLPTGPEIIIGPSPNIKRTDMFGTVLASSKKKGKKEIHATAVVKDSIVYIGSDDYHFYALNAKTGELEWSFATEGGEYIERIVENDMVYFWNDEGIVYAMNVKNGQKKWLYETLQDMHQGAKRTPTGLIIKDDMVYVTNWSIYNPQGVFDSETFISGLKRDRKSYLYAIDKESGTEKWVFSVDGNDISKPAASQNLVFFSTYTKEPQVARLYAVDRESGTMKWEFQAEMEDNALSLIVGEELVYFPTVKGLLFALDQETGELIWEDKDISWWSINLDKFLYVVRAKKLYCLDPLTGQIKWSSKFIGPIIDSVIYSQSGSKLVATDRETGKKLWKFKIGQTGISWGPIKYDDQLFFATDVDWKWGEDPKHGHLYCIDAKTGKL